MREVINDPHGTTWAFTKILQKKHPRAPPDLKKSIRKWKINSWDASNSGKTQKTWKVEKPVLSPDARELKLLLRQLETLHDRVQLRLRLKLLLLELLEGLSLFPGRRVEVLELQDSDSGSTTSQRRFICHFAVWFLSKEIEIKRKTIFLWEEMADLWRDATRWKLEKRRTFSIGNFFRLRNFLKFKIIRQNVGNADYLAKQSHSFVFL